MKMIKSTFAVAAAVVALSGVAQAVTPVTFNMVAYVQPESIIKAVTVNNSTLLKNIGKALNISTAGLKFAANIDGDLVLLDGNNGVVANLSTYTNTTYNVSSAPGTQIGTTIHTRTAGYANTDGDSFGFYSPVFVGTRTVTDTGSAPFDVTANVVADYMELNIGWNKYVVLSNDVTHVTSQKTLAYVHEFLEFSDGSKATGACKLAAGVYTQSFSLGVQDDYELYSSNAPGVLNLGSGVLTGTVSAKGTDSFENGISFLDPFNELIFTEVLN